MQERLDAPWVLELVRAWVEVGVLTQGGIVLPQKGVPPGGGDFADAGQYLFG